MAKLIVSLEGSFLREFPLHKERISIGRRPTNDLQIDNLAMSGVHATILTIGKDSFLEDLGSTNGTMVNGKSIKKHLLHHLDVIEFGKYHVKYINEALASEGVMESYQDGFEKTIMIRPSANRSVSQPNPAPTPLLDSIIEPSTITPTTTEIKPILDVSASVTGPTGRLQVINGSSRGRELLLNKALTTLGKPGVQVAVITRRPQGYFVTHVEGKTQPIVNSHSIGMQAHQLYDHDIIELAGVKMEFFKLT